MQKIGLLRQNWFVGPILAEKFAKSSPAGTILAAKIGPPLPILIPLPVRHLAQNEVLHIGNYTHCYW